MAKILWNNFETISYNDGSKIGALGVFTTSYYSIICK